MKKTYKNELGAIGVILLIVVGALLVIAIFRGMASIDTSINTNSNLESDATTTTKKEVGYSEEDEEVFISEDSYSIRLPKGWRRVSDDVVNPEWQERRIAYKRATYFFVVAENATTNPSQTDIIWRYGINSLSDSPSITSAPTSCVPTDALKCTSGDGHYYIQIIEDGVRPIPDSSLQFYAGDELQEDSSKIPFDEFKALTESVVVY